jgi:TolB-like protein/tetratricopeptide (TPR) repeat protein
MATVYLARDLKHRRSVAIKVLHPELATALGVERFLLEIQTAARLSRPHILPLFDSGEAKHWLFYVMPYVEEGTLRDRLEHERQLSIEDAVRIGCDLAEALAYAHSRGVIHRDIKPENVMFSAGRAVIADLGIAWAVTEAQGDRLTPTGVAIGTPAYMSPEQAAGGGRIDGRTDIYSLGCVIYEMLTGSPPFTGPTPRAVMARHSIDAAPPIRTVRPTVPEGLERAVLRALSKVPADRFATAGQFADALRARESVDHDQVPHESIAVLPFANLSTDPDTEYFSDGIAEEIIDTLARLPGLRVAARTSSFAFRGRAVDLAEVGAKLKVATVLEGSVRRSGSRLRITVQLIKVADGYHLWSQRYDRGMTDVFAVQEEIARAIAGRLQVTLVGADGGVVVTPPTRNLDAYHLYLKGRYYWAGRGLGLKSALECFTQALALDADYALAHTGLADTWTLLGIHGLVPAPRVLPPARAAIQRALELAPDLAEAHCAAGTLKLAFEWDWAGAAKDLQRAIELNPRYIAARYWLAVRLGLVEDRFEEALTHARKAVELDPLAAIPLAHLGLVLVAAGRYDEAIPALCHACELSPAMYVPFLFLGVTYNHLGRSAEAVTVLESAAAMSGRAPVTLGALAVCFNSLGKPDQVQAIHDELSARARREYVQATIQALTMAALGRVDEAFALLHRACDERDGVLMYSRRYPAFRLLQNDPRMAEIYQRIGFPSVPRASPQPTCAPAGWGDQRMGERLLTFPVRRPPCRCSECTTMPRGRSSPRWRSTHARSP